MTHDEKNWLAADYALGVMRGAEKTAFELELKRDRELAQLVLQWQQRLTLVQPEQSEFCPSMSESEVDDALARVFERVCQVVGQESESRVSMPNPLRELSREQLATMRPALSRLIASYLVLLERLKAQQVRQSTQAGLA